MKIEKIAIVERISSNVMRSIKQQAQKHNIFKIETMLLSNCL